MPPKAKQKIAKNKNYTGWAIFRCGYWLVCPSVITAMINRRNKKEEIIKVEIKEINKGIEMTNIEWLRQAKEALVCDDIPRAIRYINEVIQDLSERKQ